MALGAAAREALRLADVLEAMLADAREAIESGDRQQIAQHKAGWTTCWTGSNAAIKGYLTALDSDELSDADHRRVREILSFATKIEQAGDVMARNFCRASPSN